ncbi:uncharacterized protein LAJ45_07031 [Morchella importuna]|uniref:uncharacterized protein n=1 Tax=Morchella importuna TaxID=1174673 RepID=UPI001E8E0C72|nr:uncharacterized protein LAJ45_07031 [Morchella importuna]KAH8149055.1 hypothetical protein LAJ45_07031 [Morchella importuna]
MDPAEKKQRWDKLYSAVMHHTASYWLRTFLDELERAWVEQQRCGSTTIPRLSTKSLVDAYENSNKRVFLLDYEGTLASWGSPTSIILTSPQRTLDVLHDLLLDERNIVYIMSSRTPEELERLFHRVPDIGLIAESGCFMRKFKSGQWTRIADEQLPWKKSVREILEYYVERTPGTFVEERNCSFIWHYEKSEDSTLAARQAGECCNHVNDSCESYRVHAVPLGGTVLVESRDWTKATAAKTVLELTAEGGSAVDFLMSVTTVKVGTKNTQANATITGVAGVIAALQKLATIIPN